MRGLAHALLAGGVLVSAASAAQAPRPDATFTIFFRQTPIGTEQVSVARRADGVVISASGRFDAPLNFVARRMEMRYDAAWRPQELIIEATQADQPTSLRTVFAGTSAASEIRLAGQTSRETDQVSPDAVVLHTSFFGTYEALAERLATMQVGTSTPVYMAPQAEIPARLDGVSTERVQTAKRTLDARRYRLTLLSPGAAIAAEVWAEGDTHRLLRLSMPDAALDVVRDDLASVAARRVVITHEGDEDVRILASGFNLAATVTKPPAAREASATASKAAPRARFPAVVLVPGSGPLDRDLTVGDVPVFGQLAGMLADAGYIVVRYDKRGVGQSGGRLETTTLQDYADDVRAIVTFLAKRRDVDDRRIAVAGYDEGGWIALLAAGREKKIAGAVLLATPAASGAELVLAQQRAALGRLNIPDAEKQAKVELQQKINAAVLSGKGWEEIAPELRRQADTAWFQSFLAFDPAKALARVRQPLLIVHGERDRQIPPQQADTLAALAASARKKAPAAEVAKLPQVDHLLLAGDGSQPPKSISADLVSAMTKWLDKWLPPQR